MSLTNFNWSLKDVSYVDLYESLEKRYQVYSKAAKSLIEFSSPHKDSIVLDLGCGTGILLEEILKISKPENVFGLDISPAMLKKARQKVGPGIKLIKDDFTKIWKIRNKFSHILSSFTFYYFLPKEDRVFSEAFSHLTPGGLFTFNVTSYLREIKIGNKRGNCFFSEINEKLDAFLRSEGLTGGIGKNLAPISTESSETLEKKLLRIGFKKTKFRFSELPLIPFQAFKFTLEGFYSRGSKPTFSSTLCKLSVKARTKLLYEFITKNRPYLNSLPKVKIIEVKAEA